DEGCDVGERNPLNEDSLRLGRAHDAAAEVRTSEQVPPYRDFAGATGQCRCDGILRPYPQRIGIRGEHAGGEAGAREHAHKGFELALRLFSGVWLTTSCGGVLLLQLTERVHCCL